MKILTVLTYYAPHWTGLTKHAVLAAEQLAARGHEVTVLCAQHAADLPNVEVRNGVRVVRVRPVARFSRGVVAPSFPITLARLVRQHDVVHMHTPLPEALLVAALCRLLGRRLVMTHHGDVVMPDGLMNQCVQLAAFGLLWSAGHLANRVTAYSQDYVENSTLLSGLSDRIRCVYPPVEIPPPDLVRVTEWRTQLGLADRRLVGFAGRWVQEKGFDFLLQAIPRVRAAVPNAHFVYAGEPNVVYENFFGRCAPLVENNRANLTFLGLITDSRRLADFYAMCDVIAIPSRTDNMPLVEIEALLSGTPVVVTDIPGARVVIRETAFGRLVQPGDPAALASGIVEILRAPDRYRPSRAAVRRVFDTQQTITHYEQLLDGRETPELEKQAIEQQPSVSVAGSLR
jgi:glycosyltransferase involved in cell wall biosynthesis